MRSELGGDKVAHKFIEGLFIQNTGIESKVERLISLTVSTKQLLSNITFKVNFLNFISTFH